MEIGKAERKNVLDLFRLEGRRALITGGAKGLGRVVAQAFAEAGADVAVASRTFSECETAANEITASTGRRALAFAADVSKPSEIEKLRDAVERSLGSVDI